MQILAGGCPAAELPCWSTAWREKPQCPGLRNMLAEGQERCSAPWHPFLLPAQLLLTALTLEQQLGLLCSPPPWQRLCWGWHSALSSLGAEASQPALGSQLLCAGEMLSQRRAGQPGVPALPSPAQPSRAPHLPVRRGFTIVTSSGSTGELISWRAPSSSQATLGCIGGFFSILQ